MAAVAMAPRRFAADENFLHSDFFRAINVTSRVKAKTMKPAAISVLIMFKDSFGSITNTRPRVRSIIVVKIELFRMILFIECLQISNM